MKRARHLCIHGHFYQPPRENPWLEEVEQQDSAGIFHDWNARVTAECYGPNAAARLLTEERRIQGVVNNYRSISFNFGPTLLSWMERAAPSIYEAIREADRISLRERDGHGNAIAQVYGHSILPLASERDKRTQVRWGIADFRHRFGREPEGLWLAETAADRASLEVLAEHGIRYTVLSPFQAQAVRPIGGGERGVEGEEGREWTEVDGGRVDPTQAYEVALSDGKKIAVFFYDGPIAKALAFEGGLASADELLGRLEQGFDTSRLHEELLSVAVDGETFGHHKKGGDEVLAAALRKARDAGIVLTNYGQYLASHPPRSEVRLVEPSSWSCAHGVERWRSDCGCSAAGGTGWHQRWREPLREGLEALREQLDLLFEREGERLFRDPWEARDAYIEVLLDRSPERVHAWLESHERRPGLLSDPALRVQALRLLEMQRHALLMFTSCGWFFSEISGIETVQILRYAARAIQLAEELGGPPDLLSDLLDALERAPSNLPEFQNGKGVWERLVHPSVATLPGIVAHHAITRLFDPAPPDAGKLFCYRFQQLDSRQETVGNATLAMGRVQVTSEATLASLDAVYAVLHFGGNDFRASIRPTTDAASYAQAEQELFSSLERFSLSEVVRAMDAHFVGPDYGLRDLFLDERRALSRKLLRETQIRCEQDYQRIWEENRGLATFLLELDIPIPPELFAAAQLSYRAALRRVADELDENSLDVASAKERVLQLLAEARGIGVELEADYAKRVVESLIRRRIFALGETAGAEAAQHVIELVDLGDALGGDLDLWEAQNFFWKSLTRGAGRSSGAAPGHGHRNGPGHGPGRSPVAAGESEHGHGHGPGRSAVPAGEIGHGHGHGPGRSAVPAGERGHGLDPEHVLRLGERLCFDREALLARMERPAWREAARSLS